MKHITISILENMEVYGSRLAAYLSQHENSPFIVQLYLEHPIRGEKWRQADAILMTSSLMDTYKDMLEGNTIIILDEDGRGVEGGEFVYKYQSASVIYERLLSFCIDRGGKRIFEGGRVKKDFAIYVIHTPARGERVTGSVLTMCRRQEAAHRVLYMNLEQIPYFGELLGESGRREGMSDLIYYVKQHKQNIGTRIGMMAVKEEFDYLVPAAAPAELNELDSEEWQYCLESIRSETDYEKVFIDFGMSVPVEAVLNACDQLLVIHGGGQWEKGLMMKFRQIVERMMGAEFGDRIKEIDVMSSEDRV